jgi:hypothetical protein
VPDDENSLEGDPDEDGSEQDERDDDAPGDRGIRIPIDPSIFESLIPFRNLQRTIASIDFSGVRAAQQAAAASAAQIPNLPMIQLDVQRLIGESVNFAALDDLQKSIAASALPDRTAWAESLARSLNIEALHNVNTVLAGADFPAFAAAESAIADALTSHTQEWLKSFQTIDVLRLVESLDRWLPDNLRTVDDLEAVALIALDEGIPLSSVPRTPIVVRLVQAATPDGRLALLDAHRADIVDDCANAVAEIPHQWARECEEAIQALRVPLNGPAQSHAAGIIDSIVLCTLGSKGREVAKQRATEDWEDLALRVAGESLALRPLYRALVTWFPNTGTPPPDHFARHATAHAVGQPGLFHARHALIAVMLAVSLTVQFLDDPSAIGGVLPEPHA